MPTLSKKSQLLSKSSSNGPYYADKSLKTKQPRPTIEQQNAQLKLAIAAMEQYLKQARSAKYIKKDAQQNYARLGTEISALKLSLNKQLPLLQQEYQNLKEELWALSANERALNRAEIVLSENALNFLAEHPELHNPQLRQQDLLKQLAVTNVKLTLAQSLIDMVLQEWSVLKQQKILLRVQPVGLTLLAVNIQRQNWLEDAQWVVEQLNDYLAAFDKLLISYERLIGQLQANHSIFAETMVMGNNGTKIDKSLETEPYLHFRAPCSVGSAASTCSTLTATQSFEALGVKRVRFVDSPETAKI